MSCSFAGIRIETHFTISLTALRLFRQCMEETFGSTRTIDSQFLLEIGRRHGCHVLSAWSRQRAESMTWKAKTASSWPGSDVFSAWPPWTTGPFLRSWRIMQQCCSWKRSCHKEPPGVTFMPSSAGTIRVSLKLLWATSACCVPRGSLQRRCRCHMPLGCVSQKCNWRRLSGLCDRPRLLLGVRAVRCGCYLVLNLLRIPCAVYTVYGQRS